MSVQSQNNNLNYLIDPFNYKCNRLFVSSFQRIAGENNTTKNRRDSFSHYYVKNVRIKYFNFLIDRQSFFNWDSLHARLKSHYKQGMELQEKETQKD